MSLRVAAGDLPSARGQTGLLRIVYSHFSSLMREMPVLPHSEMPPHSETIISAAATTLVTYTGSSQGGAQWSASHLCITRHS